MDTFSARYLEYEARALLTRLDGIRPFVMSQVMVPAANLSPAALSAIETTLSIGRKRLREQLLNFVQGLQGGDARAQPAAAAQRRFALLRLRFGAVLTQLDLFHDALAQRSERDTGVWLAGLDALASDALALPGHYEAPPLLCYLDRGIGAAIRRARTRLPGGGSNPVAVIRVPRERMVGSGLASSLVHEVGHQAAALLGLVESLRPVLRAKQAGARDPATSPWAYWERTISEVLADCWSVARIGVGATVGLMGVVSLPSAFVFRINLDDPHPFPWIRVKLSCAIGQTLYPHPQWQALARLWEGLYPTAGLSANTQTVLRQLEAGAPAFVATLLAHRPSALKGKSLSEAMQPALRTPARLTQMFRQWQQAPHRMAEAPPCMAMAAIGQARLDGTLGPEEDGQLVHRLLDQWAMRGALANAARCAAVPLVAAKVS